MVDLDPGLVDDPMFKVVSRLADCLCKELAAAKGPDLCYCGLWFGDGIPPLGANGCKGTAWVRLVSAFPSRNFPQPDDLSLPSACSTRLAYEVEIGVARYAPRAEGREVMPDPQQIFNATRLYASDLRAASRALRCCLPEEQKRAQAPDILVALGQYTPLPYAAGRSGGTWQGWIGWA